VDHALPQDRLPWFAGGRPCCSVPGHPAAADDLPVIGMPVLKNDVPEQSTQMSDIPKRRRRGRTVLIVTLAGVLVAFCGLTARLFVFPASGMPAHVDAIVMLNGRGAPAGTDPAVRGSPADRRSRG
jgi:phosphoribosylcarboxyaminoimidazole (NCAIR) mutase